MLEPLLLDLLEWVATETRSYAEVMETWRTFSIVDAEAVGAEVRSLYFFGEPSRLGTPGPAKTM